MTYPQVSLMEICRPTQWKTITTSDLLTAGFPVYGANGKIGFFNKYTHELPTLMITCRGATCGSIHISEPKSYINGNAMALDSLDVNRVVIKYLYYYLKSRGFNDVITGSAQPQITRQGLQKILIPLPSLDIQKRIAAILEKADNLRKQCQQIEREFNALAQSVFIEMFGDPVTNPRGWKECTYKDLGKVQTGNTPSRNDDANYGTYIEWIKSDNIREKDIYLSESLERLSEQGALSGRVVPKGSVLITCIAGSPKTIGNVAIANRDVAFNQQINSITPNSDVDLYFLYGLCRIMKRVVQNKTTSGMKRIITKSNFEKIKVFKPPLIEQKKFTKVFLLIEKLSKRHKKQTQNTNDLFDSLLQKAFTGKLVLKEIQMLEKAKAHLHHV